MSKKGEMQSEGANMTLKIERSDTGWGLKEEGQK